MNKTRIKSRQREKQEQHANELCKDSDETFAYIAGYTSAGVPYGIIWEEMIEEAPYFDDIDDLLGKSEEDVGHCQT